MAPRGIVIEIVGDERSYLRSAERTLSVNTKLDASFRQVGVNAKLSADAQIAAAVKAQEALRANAAALSSRAASLPGGSKEQIAAAALAADAQAKLNRSLGVTAIATGRTGDAAKTAERDLNKMTRGVLSGSGALSGFSRSLAFASSGFLGFALGASLVSRSIRAAEDLTKAQDSLSVAIKHTGGNLAVLQPRYEAIAKAAAEFGVSQVDATTGLARATVLTGNAAAAQRAYQEALVISKATGKDFNAVLTATSKGQEGITTSLRRYGILVSSTTSGTAQFTTVMRRFGGQAEANTTASDRFRASFANFEATLGQALLPTFDKYVGELSAWLTKMEQSGRLQRDANTAVHDGVAVFKAISGVIRTVDHVTGSFAHTLELLAAFKFSKIVAGWALSLTGLIGKWRAVQTAAEAATAAEGAAGIGAGAAGAGAGAGLAGLATLPVAEGIILLGGGLLLSRGSRFMKVPTSQGPIPVTPSGLRGGLVTPSGERIGVGQSKSVTQIFAGIPGPAVPLDKPPPDFLQLPGKLGRAIHDMFEKATKDADKQIRIFGDAKPQRQFTQSFALNFREELAQAQASLTRSTADDARAARQVVARIKRLIDEGRLHGAALIQALGLEASALSTIWSAEDAAARARAQKAQEAKQRIEQQIADAIDPLRLEVALSRAEAFGKPILPRLRALLRAAEEGLARALAAHNLALEKQALDQITSLKQQIKDARTQATVTFVAPPKLELALARDQALGLDQTKDLLTLKAAILKFIRTHRKNIAAETDAYNQLAQVNDQLGSSTVSALGGFKEANTRALTAGLTSLSPEDRRRLRARLSQLGPGGTVPGSGVGAAGFIIGPDGRPLSAHTTAQIASRLRSRPSQDLEGSGLGRVLDRLERIAERPIDLHVAIDGKEVEAVVTRHQQRRRRRQSSQRRGPHAGG